MTDMLEKVARAIADEVERQVQKQGDYSGPQNDRPNYIDADVSYPELARAALMAMREPDGAVVDEIASRVGDGCSPYEPNPNVFFTAMIDAVLTQPSTPNDVTPA